MHYLVASEKIAVSAEQVRARIGLKSRDFDATLNAEIAFTAISLETRLRVGFSRQVWAIQRFEHKSLADFFRAVRFRKNLVSIGPAYRLACNPSDTLGPYHDCTYSPDSRHVDALIGAVAAWALRQDDIVDEIARETCRRAA